MIELHSLSVFFLISAAAILVLLIVFLIGSQPEYATDKIDERLRWLVGVVGAFLVAFFVALGAYYGLQYDLVRAEYDRRVEGMCYERQD